MVSTKKNTGNIFLTSFFVFKHRFSKLRREKKRIFSDFAPNHRKWMEGVSQHFLYVKLTAVYTLRFFHIFPIFFKK